MKPVLWHTPVRKRWVVLQDEGSAELVALSSHDTQGAAQAKIDRVAPANPHITYAVWDSRAPVPQGTSVESVT